MNPAEGPACGVDDAGCLTCGDVALSLTVAGGVDSGDADCVDDDGNHEQVATDLIGAVAVGDRVLVHAGVAIARLDDAPDEAGVMSQ